MFRSSLSSFIFFIKKNGEKEDYYPQNQPIYAFMIFYSEK